MANKKKTKKKKAKNKAANKKSKKTTVKKKSQKKKITKATVKKRKRAVAKEAEDLGVFKKRIKSFHVVMTAAVILLVLAVILLFAKNGIVKDGNVAATVNGEKIFIDEVDEMYNQIPQQFRSQISKEQILNQLIDEKLLMQEAKKQGIFVTETEVNEAIDSAIQSTGLSKEEYLVYLEDNDLTEDDMYDYYETQITIYQKLPEKVTSGKVSISQEKINQYYEANMMVFAEQDSEQAKLLIKDFLTAQERKRLFLEYLNNVKKNSDIQIKMDFSKITGEAVKNSCTGLNEGTVIFYAEDWCSSCNEMKPLLQEYDIYYAKEKDPVMNCFKDKIDQGMPQLICSGTGRSAVGKLSSSEIREFVEGC